LVVGRLFDLQPARKTLVKRLLRLLSLDELKQIYAALGKTESLEGASRGFVISKIQGAIETQDLVKNENAMALVLNRIEEPIAFVEELISRLERSDLVKIFEEITSEKLRKENAKISEITERLFNEVPIGKIIKNKRFQQRLKPKYVSISDIKSLRDGIELLKDRMNNVSNDIESLSESTKTTESSLKQIDEKLKSLNELFKTEETPSLEDFLKVVYDASVSMGEKPAAESFRGLTKRLQEKLGIDERTYVLKGIELLVSYYMISEVKKLHWLPTSEDFIKTIRNEFETNGTFMGKKDIPTLRSRVTKKLGIAEDVFDDLLIKAWMNGQIELEAGAPIGEFSVKYLVTKEGQKFYYARLK
jgi:hypothetical protein